MVYVAVDGRDSLVSDNYYKDGMGINQTIEQDRLAKSLGLKPALTITRDGLIRIQFNVDDLPPQPFVTAKILHPTLKAEDVIVKLLPTEKAFIGEVPQNLEGRRYIDLYSYDESWRIRDEIMLPLSEFILNQDQ